MKKRLHVQHDYLDAFVKTAQYLSGLTTQQDMWSETGKMLVNFFGAALCVFGKRRADGEITGHHWTFSDQASIRRNLEPETKEAIAEVLESSFLTSQLIFTPDPLSVAFLPITQKSQVTDVMLVGHKMSGQIPKELLNVYLAIARLIGTTAERLTSEIELRKHRDHLDELVKYRTAELTKTNEQLQQQIIERKQVEEQIKSSLKEKEILLSEIHHRVKNNMQIIISLLRLQSAKITDEKYADILKNAESRIRSMALIHETLYKSKDFANIDVTDYVKNLTNQIVRSYTVNPNKIRLKIDTEDISLGLDHAIPCGLIINELISNSLKYAFPKDREGEIKIVLQAINPHEVELTVSDDGIGIPAEIEIKKTESLGLQLVQLLAENQLEGSIALDRDGGTSFRIRFGKSG